MALPSLHPLQGSDLILDVFTHHSLTRGFLNDQTPQGNGDRLALIGKSVLDTIVTFILIAERPMLSAEDLKMKHDFILSDQSMVIWVNYYDTGLKKRVRGVSPEIFDDPKEARSLFNSYIGAVCIEHGLQATADWISKLVTPNEPAVVSFGSLGNSPTVAPPLQAQVTGSLPPPYYPDMPQLSLPASPPGSPSQGCLAVLNQTCNQLHIALEWNMNFSGPQHDPRWEVKCIVNGVERGCGLGRNQKQAKEATAKVVYQYMESINWNVQQPEPTT